MPNTPLRGVLSAASSRSVLRSSSISYQPGDFRWRKPLDQLLDKLRVAEQFLVAGVVVLAGHGVPACGRVKTFYNSGAVQLA